MDPQGNHKIIFTWRVTAAHTITYFIIGIVAMNLFNYQDIFAAGNLGKLMKPIALLMLCAWLVAIHARLPATRWLAHRQAGGQKLSHSNLTFKLSLEYERSGTEHEGTTFHYQDSVMEC